MKCSRRACQKELKDRYYKVYNQPDTGLPASYCLTCGKYIKEYNPELKVELHEKDSLQVP